MNQQKENQKKLAKGEKEEDGRGFMLTRNAYLYPPRTHTRIHHVLPFVITSIVHPYLPSSLTRIKFTLSPASTSLSHSSYSLKWRLTERGNDAWQNIEKMEGGKMKMRNRELNIYFLLHRIDVIRTWFRRMKSVDDGRRLRSIVKG